MFSLKNSEFNFVGVRFFVVVFNLTVLGKERGGTSGSKWNRILVRPKPQGKTYL
jgi:hypothetical protein